MALLHRLSTATLAAAAVGSFLLLPGGQAVAATGTLAAPTLTSPANDPTDSSPIKDIVLTWSPVTGATGYEVEISPNSNYTNDTVTLPDSGDTAATSYDVPISLPHGNYYWRVRATESTTLSAWSSSFQFDHDWDADSTPNGTFTLTADPATATTTLTKANPLFSWKPVTDASEYLVRVSTSSTFVPGATTFNCFTAATSLYPYALASATETAPGSCFTESDLSNGTVYHYEVRPYDDSSAALVTAPNTNDSTYECAQAQPECDAQRQIGSFTFQAPATTSQPTATVTGLATSLNDGATSIPCGTESAGDVCTTTPTFSWNPVAGANYYHVQVFSNQDGTNTYRAYNTPYTSLTPREEYLDDSTSAGYSWTVTPGTCVNSSADPTCAMPAAVTEQACPTGSGSSGPVITGLAATPEGAEKTSPSVPGGTTTSVTLTGANFQSGACVTATDGTVVTTSVQEAGGDSITFTYDSPYPAGTSEAVTFTVTNPDGSVSGSSGDLTVDPAAQVVSDYQLAASASFGISTATVNLSSPADATTTTSGTPTFSWSDYLASGGDGLAEARNYDLQIATDPNFQNVTVDDADIDLTQYVGTTSLADGTYYWRVAPIDESGNLLNWSSVRSITIDSTPPKVSLQSSTKLALTGSVAINSNAPLQGVITGASSPSMKLVPKNGGAEVTGTLTKSSDTKYVLQPKAPLVVGEPSALAVAPAVTDAAGNVAVVGTTTVRTVLSADDGSTAWKLGGKWTKHSSSLAKGGTYRSANKGGTATISLVGSKATLYGCTGPSFGTETVKIDGKTVTTKSLGGKFVDCGIKLWSGSISKTAVHTMVVTVTKGEGDIDEVAVTAA